METFDRGADAISNGTLPGSGQQGAAKGAAAEAGRRLQGALLGGTENILPTVAIAERYHTSPGFLCVSVFVCPHIFYLGGQRP